MSRILTVAFIAVVALADECLPAAETVRVDVDLSVDDAAERWVLSPEGGVAIAEGELRLDGVAYTAPEVFLREPIVGDMTLTCQMRVEPDGGARAFAINFRSVGVASYQWLHVNWSAYVIGWSVREQHWNELTRGPAQRPEGEWFDVKLETKGPEIRFFMDGQLVASYADQRYQAGRIGFASSQGIIRIKDLRVVGTPAKMEQPWNADRPFRYPVQSTFHELDPEKRHTNVSGKLEFDVSEPFIISSRIGRPEMGTHEQPHLFMMPCGNQVLF